MAALLFGVPKLAAQQAGSPRDPRAVQPERPTVATHAHTVAPGYLELEDGVERDRAADGSQLLQIVTVTKVGVSSHLQLNLQQNYLRADGGAASGLGDFAAGVKWRLLDGHRLLGDFAVLPGLKLPTGSPSRGTGSGTTDVSLLLISSHVFGALALDLNAGYTQRRGGAGDVPESSTSWTISTGFPVIGKLGWVAECFGYPGTSGGGGTRPTVALLTGPQASVFNSLAVDAGMIVPISGDQPHAWYLGFVWNVGRL